MISLGGWKVAAAAGLLVVAAGGWAWIERADARLWKERARTEQAAAAQARQAAVANARAAEYQRGQAEALGAIAARMGADMAVVRNRVTDIVRERARAPDASNHVNPARARLFDRLRELDAAARAHDPPGAAGQADGAARAPAAPARP